MPHGQSPASGAPGAQLEFWPQFEHAPEHLQLWELLETIDPSVYKGQLALL